MDAQLVDFESFFNQLIPLTEQDHRIMYGMTGSTGLFNSSALADIHTSSTNSSVQYLGESLGSDVVVKRESRHKGSVKLAWR